MFKRLLLSFALFASLAVNSSAQTFTLQGGNFQLAGGAGPVANGSVILTLSNPAATVIATGAAATPVYTINLDANGNMPLTAVNGNSALTPPGTFYTAQLFTLANGGGTLISTQTWTVGPSAPYSGTLYPNVMVLPAVSFAGAVTVPSATIAFSATPTFNAATVSKFYITLTGNVTSSTLTAAVKDQLVIFVISQDGVGGRTFVWPTNVKGQSIATGIGQTSTQAFTSDGTNLWPIGEMTVSSGTTDVRGNNATLGGTLAVTGTSTLADVNLGAANTISTSNVKQVSATTALCIKDNAGVCHVFIAGVSPFTNLFLQGNGSGVVFLGSAAKTSVADTTGNIITAGNISLQTTSQTLPAVISNDTAGGIALSNNAGKALQFDNSTNVLFPGSTSGNTIIKAPAVASGTLTLPAATDTLVGKATTDTLTNKTLTSPAISDPTITGNTLVKRIKATQGTALVTGDVSAITNFGTTASASAVSGTDAAGSVSIASAGTGQTANGSFVLTFHDGTWTTAPMCVVSRGDGAGPGSASAASSTTATTQTFSFNGAAVAGSTYIFNFICIGK